MKSRPRKRNIIKNAPKKVMFSIAVCEAIAKDLDDIAVRENISRNAVINDALADYIDAYFISHLGGMEAGDVEG